MTPTKDTLLALLKLKQLINIANYLEENILTFEEVMAFSKAEQQAFCGNPIIGTVMYNHLHPPAQMSVNGAMNVDKQLPSPEPKGQRIAMDCSSLLEFLERQMSDSTKFNSIPHVLSKDHMMFPLSGRDDALKHAAECLRVISQPITSTSRTDRRIPVCAGLSGLGKTRMLEEWEQIFDLAGIPQTTRLGVLVLYYNGYMPHPVERRMTIEASFAWRLLHRCFIDGNGDGFAEWFTESLPVNGTQLTLRLALDVIRQKWINLGRIRPVDTLHLFLGVDEYQTIHLVNGVKKGNQELLQDLLDEFGAIMANPDAGVRIYPMFAGTDLSAISIVNLEDRSFTDANVPADSIRRGDCDLCSSKWRKTSIACACSQTPVLSWWSSTVGYLVYFVITEGDLEDSIRLYPGC
ncbi:hypothetical protein MP228_011301 [Amoeboaphelidium protococcarum]|nr:hypothetical protein MP228_011301 [Amoeboaphelidium protococcarum]